MLTALFPFVIIFVIFYFLIIMPARKKQKKHQNLITSLKGGERVVTSGGIYGTVGRVMDDRIEVKVDKNTTIQVTKSSISAVIDPQQGKSDDPKAK
ncbi:MAG: preprotein translocase subunit YajC [bacterium]|nr:preprotein translocase subunit YajC [bacterium]